MAALLGHLLAGAVVIFAIGVLVGWFLHKDLGRTGEQP